jgi:hypothetical protein
MSRFGSWRNLVTGALAALTLGATCAASYNYLDANDCCKPGAACCEKGGSACCKHHARPGDADAH